MTKSQALTRLIFDYNISNPTEQQINAYLLFGDKASFIRGLKNSQVAPTGGIDMKEIEIETLLLKLKGVSQLMTNLCSTVVVVRTNDGKDVQESLNLIDEVLEDTVSELQRAIYRK